jgi:hypothetical protein
MWPLQKLLIILSGQHLTAGYLTPAGSGTALETVIALMNAATLDAAYHGAPVTAPGLLNTPAWVAGLYGLKGIYLAGVDGNLSMAQGPAYLMQ